MELIDAAIRAGKFSESRRTFWEDRLKNDPARTRALIDNMESGITPLKIGEVRGAADGRARSDGYGRKLVPHPQGGYVVAAKTSALDGTAEMDDAALPGEWFPGSGHGRVHAG